MPLSGRRNILEEGAEVQVGPGLGCLRPTGEASVAGGEAGRRDWVTEGLEGHHGLTSAALR